MFTNNHTGNSGLIQAWRINPRQTFRKPRRSLIRGGKNCNSTACCYWNECGRSLHSNILYEHCIILYHKPQSGMHRNGLPSTYIYSHMADGHIPQHIAKPIYTPLLSWRTLPPRDKLTLVVDWVTWSSVNVGLLLLRMVVEDLGFGPFVFQHQAKCLSPSNLNILCHRCELWW